MQKRFFHLVLALLITSACTTSTPLADHEQSVYMSISLSFSKDEELWDAFYVLNIESGEIMEIEALVATSQYAMGTYNAALDQLVYAGRTEGNDDGIYVLNRTDDKAVQTNIPVEAINSLLIADGRVFFVASKQATFELSFGYYDLSSGETWFAEEFGVSGGDSIDSISYNPQDKKIYLAVSNPVDKAKRANTWYEERKTDVSAYFHRPPCDFYAYDLDSDTLEPLFTLPEISVTSFSSAGNSILLSYTESKTEARVVKLINNQEETILDLKSKTIALSPDGNGIYYLASVTDRDYNTATNGLYYYDIESKRSALVFHYPNSWISNFYLNSSAIT